MPRFAKKLSYLTGALVLAGLTYHAMHGVSPAETRRGAHSAATEAEASSAPSLPIKEAQLQPPARLTRELPHIAEREAIPTARVRDPVVDRALHERALALGEARLAELEREVQTTAGGASSVVSFRAARLRRQLAGAHAVVR
jgi:hypothetical protein